MPRRHFNWLWIYAVVCSACAWQVHQNRMAAGFFDVMDRIERYYIEEVDRQDLYQGGLQGMVSRLDPYSAYLPPVQATVAQQELDAEFGGIGAEVGVDPETRRVIVLSPLVGTPAYRAGLQAGDQILAVNGESTEGQSVREVVERIRGRIGTSVTLTVQSVDDADSRDVSVTRARIHINNILGDTRDDEHAWRYVLPEAPEIGYIQCIQFAKDTTKDLQQAITQAKAQGMRGLVLDLRSNSGGLLTEAVSMCNLFLDEGVIVTTRRRNYPDDVYRADKGSFIPGFPIVLLVNGTTASASEIVAACLQDHNRATIVGDRTFGKGSVQDFTPLADQGVLKLTVGTYWRPNNHNIHRGPNATPEDEWGVQPLPEDRVPLEVETQRELANYWRQRRIVRRPGTPMEDPRNPTEVDRQLWHAVELLQGRRPEPPPPPTEAEPMSEAGDTQ